jgi:hypothetical protein
MPTPLYVGLSDTYTVAELSEEISRSDMDSLRIVLRGKYSSLDAQFDLWTRGQSYPGYPNVALDHKSKRKRGPIGEIDLVFIGFIQQADAENGLVDIVDDITAQSVSLTSDSDENVTWQYYGQQTTYRWISRSSAKPTAPRFKAIVPSNIPTNFLFNPYPSNYGGSFTASYQIRGRLAQFQRTRIAPKLWGVVETWINHIEPVDKD